MASPSTSADAAPASAPQPSMWRAIGNALRGKREDYTRLPLERAILLLAVPMALEMLMESTFGLVDIFFVGKLGPQAVGTVGITGSLIIVVFAAAIGLSIAATATVARRIGEDDEVGAAKAAGQAILLGVGFSVPIGLLGGLLAEPMLIAMGGSPDVAAGWPYTAVLFGGSATIFLLFLNNAIFRGAGDAAIAMRSLWLANLINMVLDPCLIFGLGPFPEMGLIGAAVATTIGRGVGVLFQLWILAKGARRVTLRAHHLKPDWEIMQRLLRISGWGILQFFIATASWLGIMWIIARFGDITLAGYTIALRLIHFAILPSWGLTNAASTLVGQNLGAKQPDRAERAVWLTGRYNLTFLASIAVIFWFAAPWLIRLFTDDPGVIDAGVLVLRISSFAYCFSAYSMVFSQAFNGAGDSKTPTRINGVVMWCWQLPLAYLLSLRFGLAGVMCAIVVSMATWAIVGGVIFKRGGWKLKTV